MATTVPDRIRLTLTHVLIDSEKQEIPGSAARSRVGFIDAPLNHHSFQAGNSFRAMHNPHDHPHRHFRGRPTKLYGLPGTTTWTFGCEVLLGT
jgi:hypothetical protein